MQVSRNIDGVEVPAHLVGDAAYPLRTWLMKDFTQHQVLDADQQRFNKALNSTRIMEEHAFGCLKGRCRCLSKRLDVSTAFVPDVVFACCVLHNLSELTQQGEFFAQVASGSSRSPCTQHCNDPQPIGVQVIRSVIRSIL
ncbi:putative nuclease HARBI1 [Narcine bancroftii]|uniref:putative nuclease HARBI1 n=1 Tax=Narcine bancroftii TaxID=1343680 RepID=UPI003832001A